MTDRFTPKHMLRHGNSNAGAKRLYEMMNGIRVARTGSPVKFMSR